MMVVRARKKIIYCKVRPTDEKIRPTEKEWKIT